jgi:competence protein ComEC
MNKKNKLKESWRADGFLNLHGLLLVVLVCGWLAGLLLASWIAFPQVGSLLAALFALGISGVGWRRPLVRTIGLGLLCLCLGMWRYTLASPSSDPLAVRAFIGLGNVKLQAIVADEPRLESHSTLLTISTQRMSLDGGQSWREIAGEMQVQTLDASFDDPYAPRYGDTIALTGRLTAPPPYTTPEIQAGMAFPALSITARGGNPLLVFLYQARTALASVLMQALPQPFAALLVAIFLSLRTPALRPLLPLFNLTGTAHMIAPSGFKVTLFAGLIGGGTGWLLPRREVQDWLLLPAQRRQGNWRRWLRTLLLACCIVAYTFLSGGGPAALRAGIMGIFLVLAPRLERFYNVYTALALTALLMSLADPFVLWEAGFQLSFVGTLGIVFFTPFLLRPLRLLERLPLGYQAAEIMAVTLAANIATWPIFILNFYQVSFVALLANILTVPLLSIVLVLGTFICLSGLLSLQLAQFCGWVAWPSLWYIVAVITWCVHLPGAYLLVSNVSPGDAWTYYALLAWLGALCVVYLRPAETEKRSRAAPLPSRKARRLVLCGLALLSILGTAVLAQATQAEGRLTITLLTTGTAGQGEALLLQTPDGQTALIDEGADSITLAQTLDVRLPFWQRSLDLLILANPGASDLAGLQDIVTRYGVSRVVDAGMLHASAGYARWRSTLDAHNLSYTQIRQGASISLGTQIALQVLWPPEHLHKGSNEVHDNALILRLLAPGLSMLLLDTAALSSYALQALSANVDSAYMQAQIVQITGEQGKSFPAALAEVLTLAHPDLLLVTMALARTGTRSALPSPSPPGLPKGSWETLRGDQITSLEIQSNAQGWSLDQET